MIDFLKKTFHIPKFAQGGIIEKPIVDTECDPPEFVVNQERFDEAMERFRFADIVQVVRCKDCLYYDDSGDYCRIWCGVRHQEHFCGEGERKDNNEG